MEKFYEEAPLVFRIRIRKGKLAPRSKGQNNWPQGFKAGSTGFKISRPVQLASAGQKIQLYGDFHNKKACFVQKCRLSGLLLHKFSSKVHTSSIFVHFCLPGHWGANFLPTPCCQLQTHFEKEHKMKKSFIRRTMIFFIAISLIPFLIFTLVFINKTGELEAQRVEDSLSAILKEKTSALEKDLKSIENETVNFANWASYIMGKPYDPSQLSPEYRRNEEGVLERHLAATQGRTNVFLPNNVDLSDEIIGEVLNTEQIEGVMANILEQNEEVGYAYIITANGLLRVYPYLENEAFAPDHDQRSDYFYTRAIGECNPEGKSVWTNPYYDYGGKGWVITCASPFYLGGELGGVVCIDVSLKTMADSIADFRMGNTGFAFVISETGDVIYHPEMMDIISDTGERYQLNLLNNSNLVPAYRAILEKMVAGETGVSYYMDQKDQDSIVAFAPIKNLDWSIGVEVKKWEYAVGSHYQTKGFWLMMAVLLVVCLAMASILSNRITAPIKALTEDVKRMADGNFGQVKVSSEDEIGLLGEAYNKMSKEISEYTSSLVYKTNQLETVINSLGGVMMIVKPDFAVSMMNQKGLALLKISDFSQISGENCCALIGHSQGFCRDCPVKDTFEKGITSSREVLHNQNVYNLSSYPVFDEKGEVKEAVVYSRKITEEVMLQKELLQSEKMAGLGQLVAGVTHELKNPLAVIKGAAYLLKQGQDGQKQEDALKEINTSISRAEKIIYNMLDFSKKSWDVKSQIPLKGILEQIFLLVRQDLVKRKINLNINLEEESLGLYGNADSFKHIFLNVITNAIDAMPDGGELEISARRLPGDKTEIIIANTGDMIPEEDLKRIFHPFYTTKHQGTGLGLWIVSKEIEKNRGTIEAFNSDRTQMKIVLPGKEIEDEPNFID